MRRVGAFLIFRVGADFRIEMVRRSAMMSGWLFGVDGSVNTCDEVRASAWSRIERQYSP